MGRRWKDIILKDSIGGTHPLTLRLCMIAVAARHMDGKISIWTVLSSCVQYNIVTI